MKKTLSSLIKALFLALVLAACGGSGGSPGTATVSVGITDNSAGFDSVVLTIEEIGIVASSTPTTYYGSDAVAILPITLDVLDYPGSAAFHLADIDVPMPDNGQPLCFNQIRFVLARDGDPDCTGPWCNYVIETGAVDPRPLVTPSGQQSGIKLLTPKKFCAQSGDSTVQVAIDFDPATAIVHDAGKGEYLLKPTGIRIIEGAWGGPSADYVEGTVRIAAGSGPSGCSPLATTPLVTVSGRPAGAVGEPVSTTVSLADALTVDCYQLGHYKLLLPAPGLYDLAASWDGFAAAAGGVASGSSGVDMVLDP